MNVRHNCRMRCAYPDYGSWLVGRIRCVSIASDTNPHAKYKRGAVSRSPLVRLESELLQVFQNSIKQLQCCNNEFEDKNGDIHQAHTRLLWFRSTAS